MFEYVREVRPETARRRVIFGSLLVCFVATYAAMLGNDDRSTMFRKYPKFVNLESYPQSAHRNNHRPRVHPRSKAIRPRSEVNLTHIHPDSTFGSAPIMRRSPMRCEGQYSFRNKDRSESVEVVEHGAEFEPDAVDIGRIWARFGPIQDKLGPKLVEV